jgi:peptide/nickel transport system substrate-binding protein
MSEKDNGSSPFERQVSRRELLEKAGKIGAGALVAGSLAGPAAAATRRVNVAKKVPTGGSIVWGQDVDPGHIAPFGGILTANHQGNEMIYDSLLEWDPKLNIRNAIAESYTVVNPRRIDWTIKKGIKFSNGQEVTAADVKYSFDLQANPPLPGSVASTTQFPGIESTQVISKYKLRMNLKAPDARVYGYLAWGRYSSVVPNGMYQMLDPAVDGIGTGPFKLDGKYVPNSGLTVVRNPNFWKKGLPYLDSIQYRVITDEQSRVAALRAGAIQGATVTADSAAALRGANGLTVLSGLNASFRELQVTIKQGETKPWHDKRVRQAVNFAINRQNIIDKVYGGFGRYSGHIAAGYGPWPLSDEELRTKYEKYDVPKAKALMKEAGVSGFDVTMTTFAAVDYAAMSALIKADLAQIGINVNIVPQDSATFAARNGAGQFDWDLTGRGMRGDPDGYTNEYHPASSQYKAWFPGYKGNTKMFRLIGNGRIVLDPKKRLPMYQELNKVLMDEMLQVPLISFSKFQVVSNKLKNMYVAFSDFNPGLRTAYLVP